ncbi:MAG: hypothetical protein EP330_09200 [Deltaproteobacteria bacterium]|nr:MAG: hypothetical protein EP330_09200 [Deltaproteobacteria bacterium]
MTLLLYMSVAVLSAGLATRAWLEDRGDGGRRAFLGLGWSIAVAYGAFALSLLPSLGFFRVLYMLAGLFIPGFALWSLDRVLRPEAPASPMVARLMFTSSIVAPATTLAHVLFFYDVPRSSPAEAAAGLYGFCALGLSLHTIWKVRSRMALRVDQARLTYLLGTVALAVCLTLLEHLARNLADPVDTANLTMANRGVVLQGALPPLSVLFTALSVYFIDQSLVMLRLLDLQELFSRVATLVASAAVLVVVYGLTATWTGAGPAYPFHSTFQIFLASLFFLAAYDPLRGQIAWWSNRLLNQRGQKLTDALDQLRRDLPTAISTRGLTETLLARLHASGRVPSCSVYLWDRGLDAFALAGRRGSADQRPLTAIASQALPEHFRSGATHISRHTLARRARFDEVASELVGLLDAMDAELVVPFLSKGLLLGWVALKDEEWSDGFSGEEVVRLRETAELATVALTNIQGFQQLEEAHRLAALGSMAAGMAHEIRNPLAGIKGAAEYLQTEDLDGEAQEMLQVVVDEADRLNIVVSQFLDYARPLELHLEQDHVNALVTHIHALLRAQGIPEGVSVEEDLAPDLPPLPIDRARLSQVLLNLVRNAIQAMPSGGVLELKTARRLNRGGMPCLEIAVNDTGEGIDSEDLAKLFIPFFTTKSDGTGLGLPICQRIVQAHGGELDVLSVVGRGSSFLVRLPLPAKEPTQEISRDEIEIEAVSA